MPEQYEFLDALERCGVAIRAQVFNSNTEEAKRVAQATFETLFLALADAHSPLTMKTALFVLKDYQEVMKR